MDRPAEEKTRIKQAIRCLLKEWYQWILEDRNFKQWWQLGPSVVDNW